MKLTSLESLKLYLDIEDNIYDDLFSSILDHVSLQIENALNRKLIKKQRTQWFNGGKRYYYLNAYPIDMALPRVIEINGDPKIEDTDYYVWEKEGLIHFIYVTPDNLLKNIKITWTGGYIEEKGALDVPYDLKQACLIESAFRFHNSLNQSKAVWKPTCELLPEVIDIIKFYSIYPHI